MTFDGITMRAIVHELHQTILGGHVKKINQIGPHQLTLNLFNARRHFLLYLSCDAASGRLHLSEKKYQNPQTPPNFVMLLRKQIGQGKLTEITQIGLDRTVRLSFGTRNELGDPVNKHLMLEIMGRHSNLILLDDEDRVIEAMHRVSHDMSRVRPVYPGTTYKIFPSDKIDVLTEHPSLDDLRNRLLESGETQIPVRRLFYGCLTGFSPLISDELCVRANIDPQSPLGSIDAPTLKRLNDIFQNFADQLRNHDYAPVLYQEPKIQAYPFPLTHYGSVLQSDASISRLIDQQTVQTNRDDGFGQQKASLLQLLARDIEKKTRKLQNVEQDYAATLDRQTIKEEADLLAAYAHSIQKGETSITVSDFYHEGKKRRIALDPTKSGHENMEAKYRHFAKLNTAHRLLKEHLPLLKADVAYAEQLKTMLDQATQLSDLADLKMEFEREGLLRRSSERKKKQTEMKSRPRRFETTTGKTILVGRNNLQNDRLTLKMADKEDVFFHAKTIPGAHVILRTEGKTPTKEELEAAAWIAARFSSTPEEPVVDIDYTERKNVYKAKGAKPGMVYYHHFHTISVQTSAHPEVHEILP